MIRKGLLFIAALIFITAPAFSLDEYPGDANKYERADSATIKMHTKEILSRPEFSPKKTFRQWLLEKLSKWKGPDFDISYKWKEFFLWFAITWCVLALAAMLIHIAWTISLLFRTDRGSGFSKTEFDNKTARITSFDELYRMARESAEKKDFREAVSLMILALLRWLDFKRIISFHESKTNGDYMREFSPVYAGRSEFIKFVSMFEQTIYGRLCNYEQTYQQMDNLMERIRTNAGTQTQK